MAKTKLNLAGMDFGELWELRGELENALRDRVAGERAQLEKRLAELSALQMPGGSRRASGANGGTARGRRSRRTHPLKGTKAPIKYRGPGGETWSGRGLTPRWLAALEARGKKRESYLVQPA